MKIEFPTVSEGWTWIPVFDRDITRVMPIADGCIIADMDWLAPGG
ncbi:MAG: hypothetical protein V3T60_14590 [Candidatus Binatia bacterium]